MSERKGKTEFITPEEFTAQLAERTESNRGRLLIAGCRKGTPLAGRVVERYDALLAGSGSRARALFMKDIDRQFSDGETQVRLDQHVSGYDVYLFQTLFDPMDPRAIDHHYLAFLIAARAFREHGANRITGILPYLAYSRQDKPTKFRREPTTAKLMADLATRSGIDRLITWAPHAAQIRGFYGATATNFLDPLGFFLDAYERFRDREDVIAVAPDVGASKFVTHFARSLVEDKGIEEVFLGASHNLCVGSAGERLRELNRDHRLRELLVTDTVPQPEDLAREPFVRIEGLADAFARCINRIHYNRSVSELFIPETAAEST